mgnify:FL=1
MSNCDTCPSKNNCNTEASTCGIKNNPHNNVKHIIGVMSGKGGVGKSTVAAMIAEDLNSKGYSVGIMDADITGPSIPRLLNISDKRAYAVEEGLLPVETENGIKVVSLNLLMEDENQPVIWRGPIIASLVEQFWTEVYWGELDYLIIDMPPGTGDVALTVMQSIPLSGIIMVSVPQDLVSMIVSKAINMVNKMNIPVLGVVENMSYVKCPDCGKKIQIFETDNIDGFLGENNIKLLGELPMSKDLAGISQDNRPILDEEIQKTFENIGKSIVEDLS